MKKLVLIINLSILIILFGTVLFFLWQLKNNIDLKKELTQKTQLIKEIETTGQHIKELEEQSRDLKQKAEALYKRVPVDEKQPLSLIKVLINIGGEIGLKEITFSVKEESKGELEFQAGSHPANQEMSSQKESLPEGMPIQEAARPAPSATGLSSAPQTRPKPIYLEMNFAGTYPQLLIFLEKLARLERIVSVEKINIQRDEKILFYQKISLDLVTYIF